VVDFSQLQAASQLSLFGSSTQARYDKVSRSPRFAVIPAETHFIFQNGCSLTGTAASKKKSDTDKAGGHVRGITSSSDQIASDHFTTVLHRSASLLTLMLVMLTRQNTSINHSHLPAIQYH
jgi:hypothetical protein